MYPLLRSQDEFWIYVVDFRHVAELHEAVRRKDLVSRRIAEPGEAAARDFKGQQPLIAVGDVSLGLSVYFWSQLFRTLHVIECKDVGVRAGGGLLEAAAGHAENAVHAFDNLAEWAGIKPDKNLRGVGDGSRGKVQFVLHGIFQASVEDQVLFAAVRNHFDFPHHDVGTAS